MSRRTKSSIVRRCTISERTGELNSLLGATCTSAQSVDDIPGVLVDLLERGRVATHPLDQTGRIVVVRTRVVRWPVTADRADPAHHRYLAQAQDHVADRSLPEQ